MPKPNPKIYGDRTPGYS